MANDLAKPTSVGEVSYCGRPVISLEARSVQETNAVLTTHTVTDLLKHRPHTMRREG